MNAVGAAVLLAAGLAAAAAPAAAQTFPSRPISILVPFSPGGSSDQFARLAATKMAESIGQPVIVENKPGGNGQVAANALKLAKPDGHTLLLVSHGIIAINPALYEQLSYDPLKDFEPVTLGFKSTHILLVPANSPVRTAAELVGLARSQPGKLSFASVGTGSGSHIVGEMFKAAAAIDVVHVPYKGSTSALPDVISARVDYFFDGPGNSVALVREGKLKALAVTDTERLPLLPDVPTIAEAGFRGNELNSWFGIVAPAGTPKPVVAKLHGELVKAMQSPDVIRPLAQIGSVVVPSKSPEEFAAMIASESDRLGKVVKASGAKAD